MKILITGITGFAGSHLADYLIAERPEAEIAGLCRWRSQRDNLAHLPVDTVRIVEGDIRDQSSLRDILAELRPDYIFHLAAQSFVPTSWRAPHESLSTNLLGQLNLFEAVRGLELPCRIQIAGSSEEYGLVHPQELPITEDQPLRPLSPYAVSKVGQDALAYQYFKSYGLPIVRTRGFNHTGPRRPSVFVCSDFARQLVEIELGLREPRLRVGNLEARRDFTDVRDIVRGYWLALDQGEPGEVYNLCSGKSWSIQETLDLLIRLSGVTVTVETDPDRLRPSDVLNLEGDAGRLRAATGWEPRIPLEQTLGDLLNYWRKRLGREGTASA